MNSDSMDAMFIPREPKVNKRIPNIEARQGKSFNRAIYYFDIGYMAPELILQEIRSFSDILKGGENAMRWILLLGLVVILMAECSLPVDIFYNKESPRAPLRDDEKSKRFVSDKQKGTIHIFRDRLVGNSDAIQVLINEKIIGNLGVYTYFAFKIPPGNYELRTQTEMEITTINVGGGDMIFINAKVGTTINQQNYQEEIAYVLKQVSVERGKLGVLHSERLKHQYHILPLLTPVALLKPP